MWSDSPGNQVGSEMRLRAWFPASCSLLVKRRAACSGSSATSNFNTQMRDTQLAVLRARSDAAQPGRGRSATPAERRTARPRPAPGRGPERRAGRVTHSQATASTGPGTGAPRRPAPRWAPDRTRTLALKRRFQRCLNACWRRFKLTVWVVALAWGTPFWQVPGSTPIS